MSQSSAGDANPLQDGFAQALALHQQGALSGAEKIYREILQQQPHHFDALRLSGVVAPQTRNTERGVALFADAIKLNPRSAAAHNDLGIGLVALDRFDEAIAIYDEAIALRPGNAQAYYNRGNALCGLKRYDATLANYDKALALQPDYADAYNNRGAALHGLQRHEAALASYDKALALQPDYAKAHWSRCLCLLQMGHLQQGWQEHEWRRQLEKPIANRDYPQPPWLGQQDIAGKTLFIYWEQGLGDTLQFCRYARLVLARAPG